jgi:hypothetical protein
MLPMLEDSDDFLFDNEMLLQAFYFGFRVGEITSPSVYTSESSSISFFRSMVYGFGVLKTALSYRLCRHSLMRSPVFDKNGRTLPTCLPAGRPNLTLTSHQPLW